MLDEDVFPLIKGSMTSLRSCIIFVSLFLVTACTTLAPQEHQKNLNSLPAEQLQSADSAQAVEDLNFKQSVTRVLDSNSPVMSTNEKNKTRSYFKKFKISALHSDQYIEIKSFPYKPLGFGQIGIIEPLLYLYDENNRPLKSVAKLHADYDRSFIDGEYYRVVWRLSGLRPNRDYFVVIAANTEVTGKAGKSFTNYGGASTGIIMTHSVQFSPVGKFTITQSDMFKK